MARTVKPFIIGIAGVERICEPHHKIIGIIPKPVILLIYGLTAFSDAWGALDKQKPHIVRYGVFK